MSYPPLRSLHADESFSLPKLERFGKLSTEELLDSLRPGEPGSLKARPDGTVIDGHHRVKILRDRGIDVDALPREVIRREEL